MRVGETETVRGIQRSTVIQIQTVGVSVGAMSSIGRLMMRQLLIRFVLFLSIFIIKCYQKKTEQTFKSSNSKIA